MVDPPPTYQAANRPVRTREAAAEVSITANRIEAPDAGAVGVQHAARICIADRGPERINVDAYLCVCSGGIVLYSKMPPASIVDHHRPDLPSAARPFLDPSSATGWQFR